MIQEFLILVRFINKRYLITNKKNFSYKSFVQCSGSFQMLFFYIHEIPVVECYLSRGTTSNKPTIEVAPEESHGTGRRCWCGNKFLSFERNMCDEEDSNLFRIIAE